MDQDRPITTDLRHLSLTANNITAKLTNQFIQTGPMLEEFLSNTRQSLLYFLVELLVQYCPVLILFTTVQLISFDISPHCSTLLYSLIEKCCAPAYKGDTKDDNLLTSRSLRFSSGSRQSTYDSSCILSMHLRIVYAITKSSSTLNFLILRLRSARTKTRLII